MAKYLNILIHVNFLIKLNINWDDVGLYRDHGLMVSNKTKRNNEEINSKLIYLNINHKIENRLFKQ